jgi:hypothetical protein
MTLTQRNIFLSVLVLSTDNFPEWKLALRPNQKLDPLAGFGDCIKLFIYYYYHLDYPLDCERSLPSAGLDSRGTARDLIIHQTQH